MTETPEQIRNRRWPRVAFRSGPLAAELRARSHPEATEPEISEVARRDLGRYYYILRRSMPTLSQGEASLLCDVLNGTNLDEHTSPYLWAEVSDALADDPELAGKWGVDGESLIARIRALSVCETMALVDGVERFWRVEEKGDVLTGLEESGLAMPSLFAIPDGGRLRELQRRGCPADKQLGL